MAEQRMQEIRTIHRQYAGFYRVFGGVMLVVVGVIIGATLFSGEQPLFEDITGYFTNLYTEGVSVALTVLVVDFFARKREEQRRQQETQQRLTREAGSLDNATAINALREIKDRGWLNGGLSLLAGMTLRDARLTNADLSEANLQNTTFLRTDLTGANLDGVVLNGGNLAACQLDGASFNEARLRGVKAYETDFSGALMVGVDLSNAELDGARILKATISDALLPGARLKRVDLRGAALTRSDLSGAVFWGADLEEANLAGASLVGADLRWARLTNARLSRRGARADLRGARFNRRTILPDNDPWTPEDGMDRLRAMGAIVDDTEPPQ